MNFPPISSDFINNNIFHKIFKVTPTGDPSLRVKIEKGSFWVNNIELKEYEGGLSPIFELPSHHGRWALLVISSVTKLPKIIYGEAAPNNPKTPILPSECIPLAWTFLESNSKYVTHDNLFDARPFFSAHKHISATSLIASSGSGSGLPLFQFTPDGLAKFYSLKAGRNITLTTTESNDILIETTYASGADIAFENVKNIDCGLFTE